MRNLISAYFNISVNISYYQTVDVTVVERNYQNFETVKLKLYKVKEDKNVLTTFCNNGIIPNFIKLKSLLQTSLQSFNSPNSLADQTVKFATYL